MTVFGEAVGNQRPLIAVYFSVVSSAIFTKPVLRIKFVSICVEQTRFICAVVEPTRIVFYWFFGSKVSNETVEMKLLILLSVSCALVCGKPQISFPGKFCDELFNMKMVAISICLLPFSRRPQHNVEQFKCKCGLGRRTTFR